ncbi:MAG: chemotaxis response regulator protein-glutamate methylesterase [Methylomonas sp.]|nr:chemotaxis response regulator protein-glutamate methylesterase [Methylomonas sp.]PPD21322.1 MAG: chemotaxis response regulator protein-glutamate methylesterase [Methylomonas sp.]PPD26934.1 MAG: chemotaxis response regulator protein-glutamate methylesterase [Methylomonas sp.]PPD38866.1 MAG: chemotaxis response regulator protein-glutamate methylesterase [Methylomonas sp.]PPD41700.1 MAG: chemotaxis response regulator protein-glutamate methylesterase [Methylomonas sp.]
MTKIKVLIVDDSALIRQILTQIFQATDDIEVVGTAGDPLIARDKIKALNPDVLTLDVEMPRMDGLTFLRNLMRLRPMPVVMVSTLTAQGAEVTLEALALGAVDFVAKPKIDAASALRDYAEEIIQKVRLAATARVKALEPSRSSVPTSASGVKRHFKTTDKIIAMGSSTGGTEAVKQVVSALPPHSPAIVVTQHLPVAFSASFAKHVGDVTTMPVHLAQDGQPILPGNVYIAPGDSHLLVVKNGARYACRLDDGPPVNRHKPSVEVLFQSIADNVGINAIGVMLTGMGADGAKAMVEMRKAGAINIVQDEASSVVWGMPGEAFKQGAAHHVVSLENMADKILHLLE